MKLPKSLKILLSSLILAAILFAFYWKFFILSYLEISGLNAAQIKELKKLHPKKLMKFIRFVKKIEILTGGKVIITHSYRPFYDEVQGTGSINSASIGRSYHNYGLAIDINVIMPNGDWLFSNSSKQEWKVVSDIADDMNIRWGGEFNSNYDPVHFDLGNTYDMDWLQYQYLASNDKFIIDNRTYLNNLS